MEKSNNKSLKPGRISGEEFSRRCEALFGEYWPLEVAYNLGRTRQGIEAIRNGKYGVRPELQRILEGWEKGRIKIKKRPAAPTLRGRKRGWRMSLKDISERAL